MPTFDASGMKKRFQSVGNRFTFFLAIEYYKPQICEGLAQGLKNITPDKFRVMVDAGEFFEIPPKVMAQLANWKQHAKYVKPQLIAELFAGARPDLYKILEEKDALGGVWLIQLHKYLINLVMQAEQEVPQDASKEEVVILECWSCHQKWPVAQKDVPGVKCCPFCKALPNEPAKLNEPAKPVEES